MVLVSQWGINGALASYGTLIAILLFSYSYLARQCNYKRIKWGIILRILGAAFIAILPVLLLNLYLTGLLSAIIGSIALLADDSRIFSYEIDHWPDAMGLEPLTGPKRQIVDPIEGAGAH